MLSRSLRMMTVSSSTDSVDLSESVEECSHDEGYRVNRTQTVGGRKHCTCGKCGSGLWIVDGTVMVPVKKAKVIDFTYKCIDCDAVFEYPGGAADHECDS